VNVAFGLKAHSGWAALVAVGRSRSEVSVVQRCRLELVEKGALWAKHLYHAAEGLEHAEATDLVRRGIESARGQAARELAAAVEHVAAAGHVVVACAVLTGGGMPDWSIDQILAAHFRMHKAEGELFRDALTRAARASGLRLVGIPEKELHKHAQRALRKPAAHLQQQLAVLGKTVGPPWARDQKDATLAAMVGLQVSGSGR
jgi:hypothetical protein